MSAHILGVDGGQTSTKVVIATVDGQVIWYTKIASAFANLGDNFAGSLQRRLGELLVKALAAGSWEDEVFEMAVLGMSGAEPGSPLINAFRRAAEGAVRASRYSVVHDAVSNLLGASVGQPGIVVIAGGGAVAYGIREDGHSWASGGWGYTVGDEGSGYNIGRAAINSTFRAIDGREAQTLLSDRILRHFRIASPVALKYAILSGELQFQDIAGLPPLVAQVAAQGDVTAQNILQRSGRDLAEAAVAVARALGLEEAPLDVFLTGGLIHETRYLVPAFRAAVLEALPQASFHKPAFEPVVGTLFLAYRELGRSIDQPLVHILSQSWRTMRGGDP
jgi:N-acetylglucosamine kinase-like BadF-type ATPase